MNELVWGVDLVEEQMLASAGIPSKPYIAARPSKYVAEYSVNAKQTGIIKSLDFCQVPPTLPSLYTFGPLSLFSDLLSRHLDILVVLIEIVKGFANLNDCGGH